MEAAAENKEDEGDGGLVRLRGRRGAHHVERNDANSTDGEAWTAAESDEEDLRR